MATPAESPAKARPASCRDPKALVSLTNTNPYPDDQEEWDSDTLWIDLDGFGDAGRIDWEGRLNGDDADDIIVRFYDCGNYGECSRAVLAGCGGGKFVAVFEDYPQDIEVSDERDAAGWLELLVEGRTGGMENDYPYVGTYAFNGQSRRYESVASWHYELRAELDGSSQECEGRAEVKRSGERVTWNVLSTGCEGELSGIDPLYEQGDYKRGGLVRQSGEWALPLKPPWSDVCTAVVKSAAPPSIELECLWTCAGEDSPCKGRVTYRLIDRPAKK